RRHARGPLPPCPLPGQGLPGDGQLSGWAAHRPARRPDLRLQLAALLRAGGALGAPAWDPPGLPGGLRQLGRQPREPGPERLRRVGHEVGAVDDVLLCRLYGRRNGRERGQRRRRGRRAGLDPPAAMSPRVAMERVFALDARSLAVYRVGLGLLLLWDL